jgi:transposase
VPKLIRVRLTPDEEAELARRRASHLAPHVALRLEAVRLSHGGWTVPRIARHLAVHEYTARKALTRFAAGGFAALADRPRSGRPPTVTPADLDALVAHLDAAAAQGETWTLARLARWLAQERAVAISAGRLGVLLQARRVRWKRTKRTVGHKADPSLQEKARADLEALQPCRGRPRPA